MVYMVLAFAAIAHVKKNVYVCVAASSIHLLGTRAQQEQSNDRHARGNAQANGQKKSAYERPRTLSCNARQRARVRAPTHATAWGMCVAGVWNLWGPQNRNLKILVFETCAESQTKTFCAATWAATAIHPHSCAQPRAQLLEACALQEFGTFGGSQHRNVKMKVFETFAKSQKKAIGAATWAATAIHPHSCAQPRAQLLEACAWQGFGTCGGF